MLKRTYWSTVFSHPTSSCVCGMMCTFTLPAARRDEML